MPGGRPTKLTQVVRVRDDGTEVTAGQQVIERLKLGVDMKVAADSAGVARFTLHRWHVNGASLRALQAQGALPAPTTAERDLIEFCDLMEKAQAEAEVNALAVIHAVGQGGALLTRTTVKTQTVYDENGVGSQREVERTVVTETAPAQWTAKAWFLERRRGYVKRVELTGSEGAPLVPPHDAARAIRDSLVDFQAGQAAAEQVAAAKAKAPAKD